MSVIVDLANSDLAIAGVGALGAIAGAVLQRLWAVKDRSRLDAREAAAERAKVIELWRPERHEAFRSLLTMLYQSRQRLHDLGQLWSKGNGEESEAGDAEAEFERYRSSASKAIGRIVLSGAGPAYSRAAQSLEALDAARAEIKGAGPVDQQHLQRFVDLANAVEVSIERTKLAMIHQLGLQEI